MFFLDEATLMRNIFASTERTKMVRYFLESSCPPLQLSFLASLSQKALSGSSGAFFGGWWKMMFNFVGDFVCMLVATPRRMKKKT